MNNKYLIDCTKNRMIFSVVLSTLILIIFWIGFNVFIIIQLPDLTTYHFLISVGITISIFWFIRWKEKKKERKGQSMIMMNLAGIVITSREINELLQSQKSYIYKPSFNINYADKTLGDHLLELSRSFQHTLDLTNAFVVLINEKLYQDILDNLPIIQSGLPGLHPFDSMTLSIHMMNKWDIFYRSIELYGDHMKKTYEGPKFPMQYAGSYTKFIDNYNKSR